jgi:hypothetical protein
MLARCLVTRTCPKIFETFGSSELWNQRMTLGLVDTSLAQDIALPPEVRRYFFPGTTHGGGEGGSRGENKGPAGANPCLIPLNPNPETDQMRALLIDLTDWVVRGIAPPASGYPTLRARTLVPNDRSLQFPLIPNVPDPEGLANPTLEYDFGPHFNSNDLSGYIEREPPPILNVIPALVPTVDADGNETAGVPSIQRAVPLGTYLGWNVTRTGVYAGQTCSFNGGFIPFAHTRAERLKSGDPRLSIQERYGSRAGYLCAVKSAIARARQRRFLLDDDGQRLLDQAEHATQFGDLAFLPTKSSARSRALCGCTLPSKPSARRLANADCVQTELSVAPMKASDRGRR